MDIKNVTIESITIKNVRGFKNQTINLGMIPNKPSILVAPNGTGKSSFAIAFKSLKQKSLQVDENEIYCNNDSFVPEIIVKTNHEQLKATPHQNDLSKEWAIYVINNQNKAKTITNNIAGAHISSARMHVAPIVLIKNMPQDATTLKSFFIKDYNLQKLPKGAIPSINDLVKNLHFMADIDISVITKLTKPKKSIDYFIGRLNCYTGTKNDIWTRIENDDIPLLSQIDMVRNLADYYRKKVNDNKKKDKEREAVIYLKTIQLIKLYLKNTESFKQRIKYAKYAIERESYKNLFATLKGTWKEIKPKEVGPNFIIEIPDTNKISNGERDIIVFLAMLQQAKNSLTKSNNILIIDEIFDYLDDANLIAAQYYLTNFIKETTAKNRNIFPIILSHLNPDYFKSYAFEDMKVYYLNPHNKTKFSSKMEKLLDIRETLMRNDKKNQTETDLISKYMLHFYNDYSHSMAETFGNIEKLKPWENINKFKIHCKEETEKYIDKQDYDPVAVCVWLRECIEKYIYDQLPEENKSKFLEQHKTSKKIEFAKENNIKVTETFSLLALIYNAALHNVDKKSKIDPHETLYSRLENNTIRTMIKNTLDFCQTK